MKNAIGGCRIFDGEQWLQEHAVVLSDRSIEAVIPLAQLGAGVRLTRLDGGVLTAGFVDLQVNGGGDILFNNTPTADGARQIRDAHLALGTTTLLPTITSDSPSVVEAALAAIADCLQRGVEGIAGLHLEGPFFNPQRRGVHPAENLRAPTDADIERMLAIQDIPLLVTLAPEVVSPGDIARLSAAGIRVSAGHTTASYDQVMAAIDAGLSGFTHLFNAMTAATARQPGVVGAALDADQACCGVICDGHHVHPANLRLALAAKPRGQLYFVSDAMAPVGGATKSFQLYGETIVEYDGRLVNAEGRLAGSAIALIDAVRVAVQEVGIGLEESLRMASLYPARYFGLADRGRLQPGCRGDLVHFTDDFQVTATWLAGQRREHSVTGA
jgi:N-acetylglucosamine-6-phosphate deacetylase